MVAQWLALLPHSASDPCSSPSWITVCVEFAHSPHVCVGFLRVLRFPLTVQKMYRLGGLAMQNFPLVFKDVQVRWISHAKLPLVSKDVHVGWICHGKLPLSVQKMYRLGGLAVQNCPLVSKDVLVRWFGHAKLPLSIQRCAGWMDWPC